jgi:hypothetical protein
MKIFKKRPDMAKDFLLGQHSGIGRRKRVGEFIWSLGAEGRRDSSGRRSTWNSGWNGRDDI